MSHPGSVSSNIAQRGSAIEDWTKAPEPKIFYGPDFGGATEVVPAWTKPSKPPTPAKVDLDSLPGAKSCPKSLRWVLARKAEILPNHSCEEETAVYML